MKLLRYKKNNKIFPGLIDNKGNIRDLSQIIKDIHKEIEKIRKQGARIIVEPVIGFEGRITAFVLLNMKNTNCNLIEFAEEKNE